MALRAGPIISPPFFCRRVKLNRNHHLECFPQQAGRNTNPAHGTAEHVQRGGIQIGMAAALLQADHRNFPARRRQAQADHATIARFASCLRIITKLPGSTGQGNAVTAQPRLRIFMHVRHIDPLPGQA